MSQSTSLTASSSVPIPMLPPPPLPPYSPDTLVSCISTTTFLDPPDFSSGPASSSTAVDASKVKVWNYHSIRFTLNEAMLDDEMEPRLRFLDLNGPDPRLGPPFAPPPITSEANVRSALVEVIRTVNHIAKEHRYHPHPKTDDSYPLWQEQISQQARPDQRLYSVKIDPTSRPNQEARPRMMEAKKMAHLRSIVKLMANKAIGKGFKLIAGSDGSINLDNQDGVWTDVGADDRERVRKLVTQVCSLLLDLLLLLLLLVLLLLLLLLAPLLRPPYPRDWRAPMTHSSVFNSPTGPY